MTKTEARQFLARAREGLRLARLALDANEPYALDEALDEVIGCSAQIQTALIRYEAQTVSADVGGGVGGMVIER